MAGDELWTAIDAQRLRTVAFLLDLDASEWDRPSLCDGWRVRDVAAHMGMHGMSIGAMLPAMLKHPGSLNHVIHASAVDRARSRSTRELIDDINRLVGTRTHNVGVTDLEALVDVIIHGQDMAIPVGRVVAVDGAAARAAADQIWGYAATARGRRMSRVFRPSGYAHHRLTAIDVDWTVGDGPEIRGPIMALVLAMTGRAALLDQLSGPGVERLAAAVGSAQR